MGYRLADRFKLGPGVFWCHLRGQRLKVTVGKCERCQDSAGCREYAEQLAKTDPRPSFPPLAGTPPPPLATPGVRYKLIRGKWKKVPRKGKGRLPPIAKMRRSK